MKPIPEFENLYVITREGDVFALGSGQGNNSKPRKLKSFLTGKGKNYPSVSLYKDGTKHTIRVHQLVARTFIPNPENLPTVNHKNENTQDNRVENLEWCSYQYNKEYSSARTVFLKSPQGNIVEIYNLSKFCRQERISNGSLYHLFSGKYKQCKGWSLP